jgi:hypothetical protein
VGVLYLLFPLHVKVFTLLGSKPTLALTHTSNNLPISSNTFPSDLRNAAENFFLLIPPLLPECLPATPLITTGSDGFHGRVNGYACVI